MFKFICRRNLVGVKNKLCTRLYLSDAFKCTEAWQNRLKAPVFKNLNFGSLFAEFEKCFAGRRRLSVVDVDLFVNGIEIGSYQNELEATLLKLRADPETTLMFESTSHAAIRWYLDSDKKDDLLNILSQRLLYGIFPDVYLSLFMMDKFLKEKDYTAAVKIAVLHMLQEDCDHPILRTLSLYSCIKYLNSPDVWEIPQDVVNDDDEVVKVRIKYARNEHFDDHFDIVNPNHLVGKTMVNFGKMINAPEGISSQLIGLVLYEKYDEAKNLVQHLLQKNILIMKDAVESAKMYVQNKPKQCSTNEDTEKKPSESEEESPVKVQLKELLDKLNSKALDTGTLEEQMEKLMKKEIEDHEKIYIEKQCKIYEKWEKDRLEEIEREIADEQKRAVLKEIDTLKEELEQEEKKLFYYDNEDENLQEVEQKKFERDNVIYYKLKKKSKTLTEEIYVPPLVQKKFK